MFHKTSGNSLTKPNYQTEYLTEYLTIHIWRSRKTRLMHRTINFCPDQPGKKSDKPQLKSIAKRLLYTLYTAVYCGKIFAVSTFVTHMTLQLFLFYFKKNEECLPEDRIQTYFCKGDFKSPKARGLRTPNEGINQRYLKNWARQNMLWPYLKIWEWEWIFGRAVKNISSLGVRSPWLISLN